MYACELISYTPKFILKIIYLRSFFIQTPPKVNVGKLFLWAYKQEDYLNCFNEECFGRRTVLGYFFLWSRNPGMENHEKVLCKFIFFLNYANLLKHKNLQLYFSDLPPSSLLSSIFLTWVRIYYM